MEDDPFAIFDAPKRSHEQNENNSQPEVIRRKVHTNDDNEDPLNIRTSINN
jgi:hypothetical protein